MLAKSSAFDCKPRRKHAVIRVIYIRMKKTLHFQTFQKRASGSHLSALLLGLDWSDISSHESVSVHSNAILEKFSGG